MTIACYGLTFKADTDDLRESPAMAITRRLADFHTGRIIAVEPNIQLLETIKTVELKTIEEAENEADIFLLLVDHEEFKSLSKPNPKITVDTKGIWS